MDLDHYRTVGEAAKILKIGRRWTWQLASGRAGEDKLPGSVFRGGKWWIPLTAILARQAEQERREWGEMEQCARQ